MRLDDLKGKSELLTRLSDTQLEWFEGLARQVQLVPEDVLFEEEGPADTFFLVSEGRVGLELTSPGRSPMVIHTLGPGDLVGVSWLFPPHRWKWRARALSETTLVAFDAVEVRRRCEEDPALALEVVSVVAREIAERLHRARIQLLDLFSLP